MSVAGPVNRRSHRSVRAAVEKYREQRKADARAGEQVVCWLCNQAIDMTIMDQDDDGAFQADHVYPVSTHPEMADDPGNLRDAHRGCNNERSTRMEAVNVGWNSEDWEGLGQ